MSRSETQIVWEMFPVEFKEKNDLLLVFHD